MKHQNKKTFEKLHHINYLTAKIDALYHQASLKLGTADSVMRVLYTVYDNGGSCQLSDIYKQSGISKQTVNSAVRRLEREEVIYLEQESGREKRVYLTKTGETYVEQTAARLYAAECAAFSTWTEEEIDDYIRLMKKYKDSFHEQLEKMK